MVTCVTAEVLIGIPRNPFHSHHLIRARTEGQRFSLFHSAFKARERLGVASPPKLFGCVRSENGHSYWRFRIDSAVDALPRQLSKEKHTKLLIKYLVYTRTGVKPF